MKSYTDSLSSKILANQYWTAYSSACDFLRISTYVVVSVNC